MSERRIKITGFIDILDDEFDPDPISGPLTARALVEYTSMELGFLDDLEFTDEGEVKA